MKKSDTKKNPRVVDVIRPGWLARLTWPVTHYLVSIFSGTIVYVYLRIFNRITYIGTENVPRRANTLLLSNHQCLLDSFPINIGAYFPYVSFHPSIIPWNPAAEEFFFKTPIIGWLSKNLKCILIKEGRKDVGSLSKMTMALKTSPLTMFPEGKLSRDGSIGKARAGAGLLIQKARPTVVPVYIEGTNKVLPIGARFPRFFKRIYVIYGKPLDLSDFYEMEMTKESAETITDKVMDAIKALRDELNELKRLETGD